MTSCKICRFWVQRDDDYASPCCRYPPVVGGDGRTDWPYTDAGDWCGEWSSAGPTESQIPAFLIDLDLTVRAENCLRAAGILTLEQLLSHQGWELLRYPGIGKQIRQEIEDALRERGLAFKPGAAP